MNLVTLGLMALLVGLVLRELVVVLRARVPTQTRAVMVGEQAPLCSDEIPKIIWSYWQQAPLPPFIEACRANWRRCSILTRAAFSAPPSSVKASRTMRSAGS